MTNSKLFNILTRFGIRGVITLCLLLIAGCSNLADLERAKNDLLRLPTERQHQQAVADLVYLAEKGYIDAQGELASFYAKINSPEAIKQAARWFKVVNLHTDKYQARYLRWLSNYAYQEPTLLADALVLLEQRMQSDGDVGPQLIRLLKETDNLDDNKTKSILELVRGPLANDSKIKIYAQLDNLSPYIDELTALCKSQVQLKYECLKAQLRHAKRADANAISALTAEANAAHISGEIDATAIIRLMNELVTTNGGTTQSFPQYARQLVAGAMTANDEVFLRFASLDVAYTSDAPSTVKRLKQLHAQGNLEASVILGQLYIDGEHVIAQPALGVEYLQKASSRADAKYYLGRTYLSGTLGYVKLQEGVDLLVASGRQNYTQAYRELLRVFSGGRGVRPNRIYAHTFAAVYQRMGRALSPSDQQRLVELELTKTQKDEVQQNTTKELSSVQPAEGT